MSLMKLRRENRSQAQTRQKPAYIHSSVQPEPQDTPEPLKDAERVEERSTDGSVQR